MITGRQVLNVALTVLLIAGAFALSWYAPTWAWFVVLAVFGVALGVRYLIDRRRDDGRTGAS